jgi:hypothetical protein
MKRRWWAQFDHGRWLNTTRVLSPEARGIYIDCRALLCEREGEPLPDERTDRGAEWLVRSLAVRDRRTVHRIVRELMGQGCLRRLDDGRLVDADEEAASGGRHPQEPVSNHVESAGTKTQSPDSRSTVGQQSIDCRATGPKLANDFKGAAPSKENNKKHHDVVAAESRYRARGLRPLQSVQGEILLPINGGAATTDAHEARQGRVAGNLLQGSKPNRDPEQAKWTWRIDRLKRGEPWLSAWGPSPGTSGCLVPKDLLSPTAADPDADQAATEAPRHARARRGRRLLSKGIGS